MGNSADNMEELCKFVSGILGECADIMTEFGCNFDTANAINAERHPDKYKEIHRYVTGEKKM